MFFSSNSDSEMRFSAAAADAAPTTANITLVTY
jgi:hypothetical protein